MLEQACSLLLDELADHITEHSADGIEALVRSADVIKAIIVEEYLLDDEDGNRLGQFRACLHDPQAQRNYLGGQEEVDHLGRVVLDESADDAKAGEAQIFKGARLGGGIEEGVEIEGNVRWDELAAGAWFEERGGTDWRVLTHTVQEQGPGLVV